MPGPFGTESPESRVRGGGTSSSQAKLGGEADDEEQTKELISSKVKTEVLKPACPRTLALIYSPPADPDALEDEEQELARIIKDAEEKMKVEGSRGGREEEAGNCSGRGGQEEGCTGGAGQGQMGSTAGGSWQMQQGTSPSEVSVSPQRPVVEIRKGKDKGKGKARAEPVGGDLDDGDDGDDNGEDQAPYHLSMVKEEWVLAQPVSDWPSWRAKWLNDNRPLQDGQTRANSYYCHIVRKLDWLIMDAARRRLPPEVPEAGPLELPKKRRRMVDSNEEKGELSQSIRDGVTKRSNGASGRVEQRSKR
ncbi:hypothetical protein EV368DRAFT_87876 [Lentinula lateritia]|nr:hypothetical protein EV368DRAFT_87876 [Lentinula lateritia]